MQSILHSLPCKRLAGVIFLTIGISASGSAVASSNFTARDGGPAMSAMTAKSNGGLPGMAFVRPVLSGVLYRSGFKGGDDAHTGLSGSQRKALCKAGFSGAYYIDFGSKTHYGATSCGGNTLDYKKGRSSSTHGLMKDIHSIIENPHKGPMMVHCMWGVHSSGAVSAMALVQFCGWSETKAKRYWNNARNNAPCGGSCDKWIDGKFAKFKVDPNLKISKKQQREICPK